MLRGFLQGVKHNAVLTARQKLWHAAECCALHDAHEAVRILLLHSHCDLKLCRETQRLQYWQKCASGCLVHSLGDSRDWVNRKALMLLQQWQRWACMVPVQLKPQSFQPQLPQLICSSRGSLSPLCQSVSQWWLTRQAKYQSEECLAYLEIGWEVLNLTVDASSPPKDIIA